LIGRKREEHWITLLSETVTTRKGKESKGARSRLISCWKGRKGGRSTTSTTTTTSAPTPGKEKNLKDGSALSRMKGGKEGRSARIYSALGAKEKGGKKKKDEKSPLSGKKEKGAPSRLSPLRGKKSLVLWPVMRTTRFCQQPAVGGRRKKKKTIRTEGGNAFPSLATGWQRGGKKGKEKTDTHPTSLPIKGKEEGERGGTDAASYLAITRATVERQKKAKTRARVLVMGEKNRASSMIRPRKKEKKKEAGRCWPNYTLRGGTNRATGKKEKRDPGLPRRAMKGKGKKWVPTSLFSREEEGGEAGIVAPSGSAGRKKKKIL